MVDAQGAKILRLLTTDMFLARMAEWRRGPMSTCQRSSGQWHLTIYIGLSLHMSHQRTRSRACKITLGAFDWLFSTVRLQMCPQIACPRRCKITLGAFVWLFSSVCFQMCPQIAYPRRCKITLGAFVWLFSSVRFQMFPQIASLGSEHVTLLHYFP